MRSTRLIALTLLALAACGDGSFSPDDLRDVIIQEREGPPGAIYDAGESGRHTIDTFSDTAEEKAQLRTNGFQAAYVSIFAGRGLADRNPRARLIVSFAIAFRDEAAAEAQLAWYRDTFLPKAGKKLQALADPRLGDESFAASFSSFPPSPFPTAVILWRKGNALLVSEASGRDESRSQALGFARLMNGRL